MGTGRSRKVGVSNRKNPKISGMSDEELQERIKRIGAEGQSSVYYKHLVQESARHQSS